MRKQAEMHHRQFQHPESDHLTLLNVFRAYTQCKQFLMATSENADRSFSRPISAMVQRQLSESCRPACGGQHSTAASAHHEATQDTTCKPIMRWPGKAVFSANLQGAMQGLLRKECTADSWTNIRQGERTPRSSTMQHVFRHQQFAMGHLQRDCAHTEGIHAHDYSCRARMALRCLRSIFRPSPLPGRFVSGGRHHAPEELPARNRSDEQVAIAPNGWRGRQTSGSPAKSGLRNP